MRQEESLRHIRRFFDCVAALMALHLRQMALESLRDLVEYMRRYADGNSFKVYEDGKYVAQPMLCLR